MPWHADSRTKRFGDRLRWFRERAGLTQEELAERAGLTSHAVSALERGTRTRPYPHTVRSLADALGVSEADRQLLISSIPSRRAAVTAATSSSPRAAGSVDRVAGGVGLEVPPSQLFGREADIAEVAELLRSPSHRLVTLTGPGGVGKTRLAAAVCEEVAEDYPDGVVALTLAAVADSSQVIPSVGRAIDVADADRPDSFDAVVAGLRERRLLLVLDNFEHLLSAAGGLSRLASACPTLTVLVTSRSALRVRGECEYAVDPLDLPSGTVTSVEQLGESASGAFVLHRARQLLPQRAMSEPEIRALATLCHRLAGLPLAIELATAHLRALAPQALLARLDEVPEAGPRDLPARQRTMRATLDWSYQLLTAQEQTLFRLLGAFRGGATLDAVEALATGAGLQPNEVVGLLESLMEHSLVVVRSSGELPHRYDMLEPIGQYARSLLVADEAGIAVQAHLRFFLTLAEAAGAGYSGPDQLLWLNRIQADEANMLVAIDRSLDSGDGETAGRIVWSMWLYWWLRSRPLVGLKRAIRCLAGPLPPVVRARVHLTAATTSYAAGDMGASAGHWETAFLLGSELHEPEIAGAGRVGTGLAALGAGELERAEQLFRQALPLTEQAGDVWLTSLVHVWLGTILLAKGQPGRATVEIEQGLELARQRGDRFATYVALYNLAQTALATGDHGRARKHLAEGIALAEQTQDTADLASFLEALAVVESAEHATERIPVLLGAARSLRASMNNKVSGYYLPNEQLREQAEQQARRVLGDHAFQEGVQDGLALDLTGSVRYALGGEG